MKLRSLFTALLLAVLAGVAAPAKAQVGLYLNPVFTHISVSPTDTGPFSFLGDGVSSRWFGGVNYGGYFDFYHRPAFSLGVDVRDTIQHGNNADLNTFSVGARIEGKPFTRGIRPYGEISAGAGRSKGELSTVHITKPQFDVRAGLDWPIAKHVDFRMVELGYGHVTPISPYQENFPTCTQTGSITSPNGTTTTQTTCVSAPSANLFSVSSGLIFRFGH